MRFNFNSNRKIILSLGLLLLLPMLLLWRVIFSGDILLSMDMLLLYEPWHSELPGATAAPIWNEKTGDPLRDIYPVALYIKDSWRQGQIPFWYPYAGMGLPVLARAMNQVLYPLNNILWQIMGVADSFGWSTILHLFLAGSFTFFYLRELRAGYLGSLVAAIAFPYSSIPMTWLGLPFIFDSMVWLPLIYLGLERAINRQDWRWILLGVLGLALQVLAGSLQLVSYGVTSLIIYAVCRSVILWWQQGRWQQAVWPVIYTALIIILGFGLVAFQLLSTTELVSSGIARTDIEMNLQLPIRNLARLLIPDILGTPLDGNNLGSLEFESYLYLGILPLFFIIAALFSKQATIARLLFGIGLLFVLIIYNVPPFYQIFYYSYPAFSTLGFHRSLYAVLFLWAATAGIGADYLFSCRPFNLIKWLFRMGLFTGLIVVILTLRLGFISKYQERFFWGIPDLPDPEPSLLYHFSTLILFLFLFSLVLYLLWLWLQQKISKQVFAGGLLFLLIFDLFLAHLDFTPALPRYMLNVSPPSLTVLQELVAQDQEPIRVLATGNNILRSDTCGSYNLPCIHVHDSYLSQRFSSYADLIGLRGGGTFRDIIFQPTAHPLVDALNVKYIYAPRQTLVEGDWFSILQNMGQSQIISEYPEAGQIKHWNINNWTQPVLLAPPNSQLSYQGKLPYPAVLETAIAVAPQAAGKNGDIIFEVYVTKFGDQTPQSPLFSYQLNLKDDLQWHPVEVNLSEFAQHPIVITLVTRSDENQSVPAGWADPLITNSSNYKQIYYGVNSIYENTNYLPRAWIVRRVTQVSTVDEAQEKMTAPDFDPATEAVIEGQLNQAIPSVEVVEKPVFIQYGASRSTLQVELQKAGFLVFSDLYYPGWKVYLDGAPQTLYPTNLVMRGVYVPAGSHQIEFNYEPFYFRLGLYLSAVTVGIIIFALIFGWSSRDRRQSSGAQ